MATREFDLVFLGRRVINPDGEVPRCVAVRDGVVVAVEPYEAGLRGATTVELADDEVLLPGLVDTHVHINEPGRTEWEGYATATRAAAAGGVTTLIDMPLNSIPPTCTVDALEIKQKTAAGQCHVDVGLLGRRDPRQHRRPARAARRGGVRVQVLHDRLGGRRVSPAVGHRTRRVPRRAGLPRRDDDRPR
jgi:allantoinase